MAEAASTTPGSTVSRATAPRVVRLHTLLAAAVVVLGVALQLGALDHGLQADDNVYTLLIRSHLAGEVRGPWYEIATLRNPEGPAGIARLVDEGFLPWWSDPQLKWALFRPAAVLTHFLDMWAWPDDPRLMHIHSLLWYAALLLAVALLYRRLSVGAAPRMSALVALSFYAFNSTNGAVASWIASRNAVMSALLSVLCLVLHDVGARRAGRPRWGWLTASGSVLLVGLLSSEGTIATWGYLVAYALWVDDSPRARRLGALAPSALSSLLWIVGYRGLGYGTAHGGLYLDPVAEPLSFAAALPERMMHLLDRLLGLPEGLPHLHALQPSVSHGLTAVGLLLLCGASVSDRRMRFWMGGCIASVIPWCAGYPTGRMLLIPAVGAFGALGHAVAIIVHDRHDRRAWLARVPTLARPAAGCGLLALVGLWCVLHVPVGAALVPTLAQHRQRLEHVLDKLSVRMPVDGPGRTMVLLNTPSFVATMFATFFRASDPFAPGHAYTLGASDQPVQLSRPSQHSLRLRPLGGYLAEFTSQLPRSPRHPFAVGDSVAMGPAQVVVEAVTADGRPAQVRFDFRDIDDPSLLWTRIHWVGPELTAVPVTLPQVGGSRVLRVR